MSSSIYNLKRVRFHLLIFITLNTLPCLVIEFHMHISSLALQNKISLLSDLWHHWIVRRVRTIYINCPIDTEFFYSLGKFFQDP
ncbi:hypothetical protein L1887_22068 [Cichorium endivia]|nr:hypothetical protein L1887_22068 [Cichorium endivia]